MDKAESWSLIARHLSKSSTPKEDEELASWIHAHPENKKAFDEATRIWSLAGKYYKLPDIEIHAEWQAFLRKVEAESKRSYSSASNLWVTLGDPLKVAAGIFLVAFASWILWPTGTKPEITQEIQEIVPQKHNFAVFATADSVRRTTLPDSSIVWLNTFSEIKFDSSFLDHKVFLRGEAFFQVRPGNAPSFKMESRGAEVIVTGTAFNVNAREENQLFVTVVTGTVELRVADSMRTEKVILHALEKGTFNVADSSFQSSKNNDPSFLSWRKKNNSIYEMERENPAKFLKNSFKTRKNAINQTLIEGRITNTASVASYQKIRLTILSENPRGKKSTQYIQVSPDTSLPPGRSIDYKQTLFDVLSSKTEVTITVEGARAN